jgi:Uri superfamily endonuclease
MTDLTWHLDKAKETLEAWYQRADDYLALAKAFSKMRFFGNSERECKQQALKCKTLGIVFHDRYKLVLENKS